MARAGAGHRRGVAPLNRWETERAPPAAPLIKGGDERCGGGARLGAGPMRGGPVGNAGKG